MSNNNNKDKQKRADAKRAGQRTRNWTAIFYPEDLPDDWKEIIDELHLRWIEGPPHDKDLNADGTPKKTHIHGLFMFDGVKNVDQVIELLKEAFGESDNGSIVGVAIPMKVSDRGAIVRYMAHLATPDKAQYDVADIVGHNGADPAELLRYSATETREMIVAMEEYIEQNEIVEIADFSRAIRYDHPEWHTILATKMTIYFSAFIRSRRYVLTADSESETMEFDEDGVLIDDLKGEGENND